MKYEEEIKLEEYKHENKIKQIQLEKQLESEIKKEILRITLAEKRKNKGGSY